VSRPSVLEGVISILVKQVCKTVRTLVDCKATKKPGHPRPGIHCSCFYFAALYLLATSSQLTTFQKAFR
jgi:hypothetical protein